MSDIKNIAVAIPLFQGKMLILQRGPTAPWMPGAWNFPGGFVDGDETIEEAVIRECQEESGLRLSNLRFHYTVHNPGFVVHFYFGDADSDEVVLDFENSDFVWVDQETVEQYKLVPAAQEAVKALERWSPYDDND